MKNNNRIAATLKALLAAWVTLIFATAILLVLFGPNSGKNYADNQLLNFLRSTWETGDEMGPAVKLSLIALFSLLVVIFPGRGTRQPVYAYLKNILFAVLAVVLVLGFLPAAYSRGYGIGLTGLRFDTGIIHLYLIGAVMGGIVFTWVYGRSAPGDKK
jgi:hypothetical protein